MNEADFIARWESEKPIYDAWGEYVVEAVKQALIDKEMKIEDFLKIPPKHRLKDDKSLFDKAFCRNDKSYTDPYNEIEDKVGARFIVLLIYDLKVIHEIIEEHEAWISTTCKHFEEDKERDPLLFTYQSIHCILRPKQELKFKDNLIPVDTPCEVQIRTLLQHAHAELTHDAIYKSKRTIKPKVHRTVAKSMALIETTDDFFLDVTKYLNHGNLQEYNILEQLDAIYLTRVDIKPHHQKSSIIIWDKFEKFIDENLVDEIKKNLTEYTYLPETIKKRYSDNLIYQQSIVLFVYWMLKRHKTRLLKDWPLSIKILEHLAIDLGINIIDE